MTPEEAQGPEAREAAKAGAPANGADGDRACSPASESDGDGMHAPVASAPQHAAGGPDTPPGPDDPGAVAPEPPETIYDRLHPWTLLFMALGCVVLYQVLTALLWSAGHLLWGLMLAPVAGTVVPIALAVRRFGGSFRDQLQIQMPSWKTLGIVVWVMLAALPVIYAASAINTHFVPPLPESYELFRELVPRDAATFAGGLLGVVVLAPLAEELVFRGLVLQVFFRNMRLGLALLLSGALFGASHGALWMLLPITMLGVLLGFIVWRTGSLTLAWVGHGLFNMAAYVELSLTHDATSSRLESWSSQPLVCGISLLFLAAGSLALVRQTRRDPDWS